MLIKDRLSLKRSLVRSVLYSCPRNCDKPRLIEALKTKRIRDIACGSSHSAALTSSGELYTWGLGEYGRLGHGDNTTQLKPKMVIMHIFIAYKSFFTLFFSSEDKPQVWVFKDTNNMLTFSLWKNSHCFPSSRASFCFYVCNRVGESPSWSQSNPGCVWKPRCTDTGSH